MAWAAMRLFLLCLSVACLGNVMAQHHQQFPDTVKMSVGKGTVSLARTYQEEDMVIYETWERFTENDTDYIYRAIEYSFFEDSQYCDTVSYYVLSHKLKNHMRNVERVSCLNFWPRTGDEDKEDYHREMYQELKSRVPILKSHHLGDMPRRWYPLMKYDNEYYFSVDQNCVYEFCDSLMLFYGLEVEYFDMNDFSRLDNGGWTNSYTYPSLGVVKMTVVPCRHLKGAYIMTTTIDGVPDRQSLWTTEKGIGNYDIIDWKGNHKEFGLNRYDEIDFDSIR